MAVIKIVPMPGAVGDKGDEGAPGAQGPQGPAGQNGLPGTPALWSYQGAYNPAAAYAVGDVVVYQGQLYYTKSVTTAGTLPTNATKFDLIASKGADGTNGTNGTNGADGAPGTNGADALWNYVGEYGGGNSYAVGDVVTFDGQLWYRKHTNGGNVGDTPSVGFIWDLLAAKGEKGDPGEPGITSTSGTWDVVFNLINGTMVESGPALPGTSSWPTYAQYYTIGELVFFDVQYSFENVTNFGNQDHYLFTLPFSPRTVDTVGGFQGGAMLPSVLTGRIINNANSIDGLWGNNETIVFGLIQQSNGSTVSIAPVGTGLVYLKMAKEKLGKLQTANDTATITENLRITSNNSVFKMSGVYRKA